jgi:MSHA biogenesis protein MshK
VFNLKQVITLFIILTLVSITFNSVAATNDPTKPFGLGAITSGTNVAVKSLILQSIVHGDGIHTAVINGKVIKPGEYINQYRLVAINDDSVVLRSDDERLKLYVFKQRVLK